MNYRQTTQVPNEVLDIHLSTLSFSELKILLCIIRQTNGWKTKQGTRKQRDRISHSQFITKTGLSRRIISETIQSLILKQLIRVTDYKENILHNPELRKGKMCIYYAPASTRCANTNTKQCKQKQKPMQNREYNKTNTTKLKRQKDLKNQTNKISDWERIQMILNQRNSK